MKKLEFVKICLFVFFFNELTDYYFQWMST